MDAFSRGIADLGAFPDKQRIDALTMVASDAVGSSELVNAYSRTLLDAIYTAEAPRKLPLVYVVDAISKMRVGGSVFQQAMEPEITQCFLAAYAQVTAAPP
jgi:hypothetical protein